MRVCKEKVSYEASVKKVKNFPVKSQKFKLLTIEAKNPEVENVRASSGPLDRRLR